MPFGLIGAFHLSFFVYFFFHFFVCLKFSPGSMTHIHKATVIVGNDSALALHNARCYFINAAEYKQYVAHTCRKIDNSYIMSMEKVCSRAIEQIGKSPIQMAQNLFVFIINGKSFLAHHSLPWNAALIIYTVFALSSPEFVSAFTQILLLLICLRDEIVTLDCFWEHERGKNQKKNEKKSLAEMAEMREMNKRRIFSCYQAHNYAIEFIRSVNRTENVCLALIFCFIFCKYEIFISKLFR